MTMGTHTLAVTMLSRAEVTGSRARLPGAALAATSGISAVVAGLVTGNSGGGRHGSVHIAASMTPLAAYAASVGCAQLEAARQPDPSHLQRAVGAGILGMIPLQSALVASRGAYRTAAAVLAAFPLARRLSRKVSPT